MNEQKIEEIAKQITRFFLQEISEGSWRFKRGVLKTKEILIKEQQ